MNTKQIIAISRKKHVAVMLFFLLVVSGSHNAFGFGFGISDQIDDIIENLEDEDYVLENLIVGKLEDGESVTWNLRHLKRDRYLLAAVCDYDCDDIDICVSDDDDEECDTDTEDLALVEFRGSSLEIEVDMYNCEEIYCYYGLLVFRE